MKHFVWTISCSKHIKIKLIYLMSIRIMSGYTHKNGMHIQIHRRPFYWTVHDIKSILKILSDGNFIFYRRRLFIQFTRVRATFNKISFETLFNFLWKLNFIIYRKYMIFFFGKWKKYWLRAKHKVINKKMKTFIHLFDSEENYEIVQEILEISEENWWIA